MVCVVEHVGAINVYVREVWMAVSCLTSGVYLCPFLTTCQSIRYLSIALLQLISSDGKVILSTFNCFLGIDSKQGKLDESEKTRESIVTSRELKTHNATSPQIHTTHVHSTNMHQTMYTIHVSHQTHAGHFCVCACVRLLIKKY